jgi:predicted 3-demethylubiquinone-9 3-methyltransferase (glyoxalase superfamily)
MEAFVTDKVTPFLWFDGKAGEAMEFYVSLFANARIVERDGNGGGTFEIDGRRFHAFNGGPMFAFTPAVSMFVTCASQAEVDRYWERLAEGGAPQRCGWITDRFGLSWQIVPDNLGRRLRDEDRVKAKRVMDAMMQMVKLDMAGIERAYAGS